MASWARPEASLELQTLLDDARAPISDLKTAEDLAAHYSRLGFAPHPTSLCHLFRSGAAAAELDQACTDYGPAIELGVDGLLSLHADPAREFADGDRVGLLRTTIASDGVPHVQLSVWKVERSPNRSITNASFISLDEYTPMYDLARLEKDLAALALSTGFIPKKPRFRAAAVVPKRVADELPGLGAALRATAAVNRVELDVFGTDHDPRNAKSALRLERTLTSGRYWSIFAMSTPADKWVWSMAKRFAATGRPSSPLAVTSIDDACAGLGAALAVQLHTWPERPTLAWGPGAMKRMEARESNCFALTVRARGHLVRNRYPDPERMLEHLELLADCSAAWSDLVLAEEWTGKRLEDWASAEFSITIALHDKGISAKDAKFVFEGLELDNRPHVKVDDAVAASQCGRIYFAIDDRRSEKVVRLVVDHIGLHDRS